MKSFVLLFLRLSLLALLAWPLLRPYDVSTQSGQGKAEATLLVPFLKSTEEQRQLNRFAVQKAQEFFPNSNVKFEIKNWGSADAILDLEQLGSLVSELTGPIVIVTRSNYWGPVTETFREKLKESQAVQEGRVFFVDGDAGGAASEAGGKAAANANPISYLGINDVFLPKVSFLAEQNKMSVHVLGRAEADSRNSFDLLVRQGESVLITQKKEVEADKDGIIDAHLEVPIVFPRAGTQTLTVEIRGNFPEGSLTRASTLVQVHHNKTTLLHVAVGPDISLRNLRQKLKFWPNLDLLSYYILREATDDLSIPANELSLIEFPAEKLFGSELPNFHAVIAQNFFFDTYLNERDNNNLIDYVKNGGRFFFQAGPLSFLPQTSAVSTLFPCENAPNFVFGPAQEWTVAKGVWDPRLADAMRNLKSGPMASGCVPKKEAIVLAQTKEGGQPLLLAMPFGKGIVLAAMAGDWHYFGALQETTSEKDISAKQRWIQSSDALFQWIVEFLQRRQDSGVRPPELAAPRLYENEATLLLRPRGPLVEGAEILLEDSSGEGFRFQGRVQTLPWLKLPVAARLGQTPDPGPNVSSAVPLFRQLNISIESQDFQRPFLWPLEKGTAKGSEAWPHPTLWKDFLKNSGTLANPNGGPTESRVFKTPLLVSRPWILAAALALFFAERFLVLWKGWRVLPKSRLVQKSSSLPKLDRSLL